MPLVECSQADSWSEVAVLSCPGPAVFTASIKWCWKSNLNQNMKVCNDRLLSLLGHKPGRSKEGAVMKPKKYWSLNNSASMTRDASCSHFGFWLNSLYLIWLKGASCSFLVNQLKLCLHPVWHTHTYANTQTHSLRPCLLSNVLLLSCCRLLISGIVWNN